MGVYLLSPQVAGQQVFFYLVGTPLGFIITVVLFTLKQIIQEGEEN